MNNNKLISNTVLTIIDSVNYAKTHKISNRMLKHNIAMILDSAINDSIEQHEIEKLKKESE